MEEFKWCIKMDSQEAVDYANGHGMHNLHLMSQRYAHFPVYCSILMVFKTVQEGYKELTLQEFKSQILNQPETLPEFWVVFNNEKPEFKKVIDYLFEKHGYKFYGNAREFYGYDGNEYQNGTNSCEDIKYFDNNPIILSLERFIQLTEKKMEKEIEGYKLIKPEYKEAVKFIVNNLCFDFERLEKSIQNYEWPLQRLELVGVLHLWFEPVYKPDQTVYTMGEPGNDFEVIVKDGKAFIGNTDITESVNELQVRMSLNYSKFTIHDAKVSIKGFNNRQASLSQWLAIKL